LLMKTLSKILLRLSLMTGISTSLLGINIVCPVGAEEQKSRGVEEAFLDWEKSLVKKYPSQPSVVNLKRENINSGNGELIAQKVTRVKGVTVNQTAQGLELILETVAGSARLVPLILPEGKDLVIDILDATLAFSIRNGVVELNPAPGITKITVTKADPSSIQVRITGENQTPSAEIVQGRDNLVLSIAPKGVTTQQKPDDEIEIIATGQAAEEDDYFVPEASTATRTDTSILDTPASVQVIPQQVLEDQQVIRLEEALTNVSGVIYGGTFAGLNTEFNLRGFDKAPILRDGFRQFGFANDGIPETTNLERIEVLKGPASILYGEIEPGGLINLVSKQPLAEKMYETQLQIGNRNFISPQIDFSGPLTSDKRLRYRLNALYRNQESFRDYEQNIESFLIAPTLSWQIGDRTDLSLQLEYSDYKGNFETGIPAIGNQVADVPSSRVAGELDDFVENEFINVGYNLEHRFNDNWRLQNAFRYTKRDILNV
jgi:iron complex outermembrane recepter protein